VTFDYGQRSAAAEAAAAGRLAARYGLPWRRLDLPWLAAAARRAGSALMPGAAALPGATPAAPGDASSAAAVWVPARNVVFVAIGAALAEAGGHQAVLTGFNREEAATFPDNSADFVAAMDAVLQLGTRNGVTVCSPTLAMDKAEIVRQAVASGQLEAEFWSCYAGGPAPCGRCESCVRSRVAWAANS
jgi:7-cyano-7-deazaguanine synthase